MNTKDTKNTKKAVYTIRINENLKQKLSKLPNKDIEQCLEDYATHCFNNKDICKCCNNIYPLECLIGGVCLNCNQMNKAKIDYKSMPLIEFYHLVEANKKFNENTTSVKDFIRLKMSPTSYHREINKLIESGDIIKDKNY